MKSLLQYLRGYKKECILGPLFKMLEACFDLTVPYVTALMIDQGIANHDTGRIGRYSVMLILLAMIGLSCSITAQFFAAKAAVGFATKLRHALFSHIETLSFDKVDQVGTSTLITRMTSDINQLQNGVNMAIRLFLRSPFIVFGAVICALMIDLKAALVFVAVIPLLAVVVFGIMGISMPLYKKVQQALDKVLESTRENLTGVRVIRAFHREEEEKQQYGKKNDTLASAQLFVGRIAALTNPVTYVMINLALVVLLQVSGIRVNVGALTQGEVVALVNYLSQILVELIKLANVIVVENKALACAARIESVLKKKSSLDIIEDKDTEQTANHVIPKVSFENVEYYTDKKLYSRKREDGTIRIYIVNPYQMAAQQGKYYLICNYDKYDDISNYRIDRIRNIQLLDEKCKPFESLTQSGHQRLNLADYMKEHIYMYSGENSFVKFRIARVMLSDVIDMFGKEVVFSDETDTHVSVSVKVNERAAEQFAKSYGPDVIILQPERLREKMKNDMKRLWEAYRDMQESGEA